MRYLDGTSEQEKQSSPFFFLPSHLQESNLPPGQSPDGLKALKLMNQLLQSPVDDWPERLPAILMTRPSFRVKGFWGFIGELSEFMTTPVLQKTLIELKQHEKVMEGWDKLIYKPVREVLSDVMVRYENKMQEHIGLLELGTPLGRNSKKVMNIFTKEEQEKLGHYKICLHPKWTENDALNLYKLWGSHLRTYMDVQGSSTVKRILESQAILMHWMEKDTFMANSPLYARYINSLNEPCPELTNEIVGLVHSLDDQSFEKLHTFQRHNDYGIYDPLFDEPIPEDQQVFIFWVKYMPFYLEMVSRADSKYWQCYMTFLIAENPTQDLLESIMQQFLHHAASEHQGNLVARFLEFALEHTPSQCESFKGFIEDGLAELETTDVPLIWQEKMKNGSP